MTLPTLAWIHLPRVNMGRNLFASLQRFKVDLRLSRMMSSIRPPDDRLKESLVFPVKTLTGPGPSNCSERVLNANKLPMVGHLHKEFIKVMDDIKAGIQYAFQTHNDWTLAISGTGHAAMEAACCNLVEPNDVVLIGVNGIWGERFSNMAERQNANVKKMMKPMGETFTLEEIEQHLMTHKPVLLFLTQGESSAGTLQDLKGVGYLCHKYDCILVVDSVAALGGTAMFMDDWEIDVLYTGSQKVIGAPPGASPISFSERAKQKVLTRKKKITSFYFDMVELVKYWSADGVRQYHHTAPISNMLALREGLAELAEEGLECSWQRHNECALMLHNGITNLGLQLFVQDKKNRLPCITTIKVPEDVKWKDVVDYAMEKHLVEISGGLGNLAGKVWRIGLMGQNARRDIVQKVLIALGDSLKNATKSPSN